MKPEALLLSAFVAIFELLSPLPIKKITVLSILFSPNKPKFLQFYIFQTFLGRSETREPLVRIELTTSSLPRKCSTTELQRLFYCRRRQFSNWSGRPGSNRPPEAWKATALPNELLPLIKFYNKELSFCCSIILK